MIATAQNTTRKLTYKGTAVEVWEARAQNGTRFHLFVVGTALMEGQTLPEVKPKFQTDLSDQKIPAAETAALADT